MENNLFFKYRPSIYDEVSGNTKIISELKQRALDCNFPKVAFFLGLTGVGKTTLARIYVKTLLCNDIVEGNPCNICEYCKNVDREQSTSYISFFNGGEFGTEEATEIIEKTERQILGRKGLRRVFVIDELQSIKSKVAEEKLLKVIEKQHDNCYFVFGAMRWDSISKALKGRARNATYRLHLKQEEICDRLIYIIKEEGMEVTAEFASMVVSISDNCNGSLRDAIGLLESIVYRKVSTEQELFEEFELLSEKGLSKIVSGILLGQIAVLEYTITEELYTRISQCISYIYKQKSGLELSYWQKNQILGIDVNLISLAVVANTISRLNALLKYRYVNTMLIENCIIGIINSNKDMLSKKKVRAVRSERKV